MTEPKDYDDRPQQGGQYAEQIGQTVKGLSIADKGWMLAFVLIFAMFTVGNYLSHKDRTDIEELRSARMGETFANVEKHRAIVAAARSDEIRRGQEVIKHLANSLSRQADRIGRKAEKIPLGFLPGWDPSLSPIETPPPDWNPEN